MHDARHPRGPLSRALEGPADAAAPYDFDEFLRRAARRDAQVLPDSPSPLPTPRRWSGRLRVAAVLVPVGLLATLLALVRHEDAAVPRADAPALAGLREVPDEPLAGFAEPALVDVAAAGDRVQIEDHIAWMDALLNEATVAGAPPEERVALLDGRRRLAESLQRVRRAEALLASW